MKRGLMLAPLALAACNTQPVVKAENASIADVTRQAQAAVKLSAGQWKGINEIVAMTMPNMPADAMKSAQTKTDYSRCLTRAEVEKPPAEMFGAKMDASCRYERFTMAGGRYDAVMTCKPARGGPMQMTLAGSYAADRYDVTNEMRMTMPAEAGGGTMTMKMRSSGQRIGDCQS